MQSVLTIPVFLQPPTEGPVEGQPVAAPGGFLLSFGEVSVPPAEEPALVADAPVPVAPWALPLPLGLPLTLPVSKPVAETEITDVPGQSMPEGAAPAVPLRAPAPGPVPELAATAEPAPVGADHPSVPARVGPDTAGTEVGKANLSVDIRAGLAVAEAVAQGQVGQAEGDSIAKTREAPPASTAIALVDAASPKPVKMAGEPSKTDPAAPRLHPEGTEPAPPVAAEAQVLPMSSGRATPQVAVPVGVGRAPAPPAAESLAAKDPVVGPTLKTIAVGASPVMTRPAKAPADVQATAPVDCPETAPHPPAPGFWERFFTSAPDIANAADRSAILPPAAPPWPGLADETLSLTVEMPLATRGLHEAHTPVALPQQVTPTVPAPPAGPVVTAASDLALPAGMPEPIAEMPDEAAFGAPGPVHQGSAPAAGPPVQATLPPVAQVTPQIVAVLSQNKPGVTELALAPEELGHVRLRLEPDAANPDRMVVMISFERPETLDLFRRHAGDLAEALRAAGYSGADIGFGQHGGGEGSDRPHARPEPAQTAGTDFPLPPPSPAHLSAAGSLDLRL